MKKRRRFNKKPAKGIRYLLNPIELITIIVKAPYTLIFALGSIISSFITRILTSIKPAITIFTSLFKNIIHRLGALFPSNIKKQLEKMLLVSGLTQDPEERLGLLFIYSMTVPTAVFFLVKTVFTYPTEVVLTLTFGSLIGVWLFFYMILLIIIDKRTQNVEEVLPDILTMISQNMRAGMTPYNALWAASRPEFGPFAMEIQNVARDTLAGISFEEALKSMTHRIKSSRLERVVSLMIQGMKSGGELPAVLQEIAEDIRNELALVKRMKTETTIQVMFIAFALIGGAPLLFAASNQFVVVFSKTLESIDIPEAASSTSLISMHEFPVASSPDCSYIALDCKGKFHFKAYCMMCLIISSFFGSLLISLMRSGRVSSASGMSLVIMLIIASVTAFIVLNTVLSMLFSNMMMS